MISAESPAVDDYRARGKILQTTAFSGNDQGRQRQGHQKGPQQCSWQAERLHVEPDDGDATDELPEAATDQP